VYVLRHLDTYTCNEIKHGIDVKKSIFAHKVLALYSTSKGYRNWRYELLAFPVDVPKYVYILMLP
jgi:hypothetical protein